MTPTPEQIAAAKAFVRNCDTVEHRDILRDYMALGRMTPGVASQHILLAALEAAEHAAKGAQAKVKEWEDEAARQGGMHAGGFEYFTARVRNANQQAHNAIYVAQQLEKKLEAAEADGARLDWLWANWSVRNRIDGGVHYWHKLMRCEETGGTNLREAIDAARKEAQP